MYIRTKVSFFILYVYIYMFDICFFPKQATLKDVLCPSVLNTCGNEDIILRFVITEHDHMIRNGYHWFM